MPKKGDRADHITLKGLKEKTIAYLNKIERYDLDPILPQLASQITNEDWQQHAAEGELLTANKVAPESPAVYKGLGVLSLRKMDFGRAEQYFKESLRRAVRPDTLTLLGIVKYRLHKLIPARRSFQQAIVTDPDYKEAYYNLALTLNYKKRSKAISILQKAVEIAPQYAAAHRELGWALKLRGQYSDSERHLRRSIRLDKSDGWAYIYLGNLMWSDEKPTEAERAYKQAIKTWPKEGTPYWCLADFYRDYGRLKEAGNLYRKAAQLNPDSAVAHSRLGLYLKLIEKPEEAKKYLERALSLDPTYEKVRVALDELNMRSSAPQLTK